MVEQTKDALSARTVKAEQVDCPCCQGHGDVTRTSGQTAESYAEHNEECPECQGTGLATSLPAAGSAVEEVEVVGYRFFHVDHGYIFRRTHIYEGNPSLEAHSLMTVAQHERIVASMAALRDHDPINAPYLMFCLNKWWPCSERQLNAARDRNYPIIDLSAKQAAQHPDDVAVDRFAAAMKSKLAKSREKGRHGWQTASAAHLSSLLYHHMYKADPLDVANLAMMLHQNGQAIELPYEARKATAQQYDMKVKARQQRDEMRAQLEAARELLRDAIDEIDYLRGHSHACKGVDRSAVATFLKSS